jgi:hypothetical protein
MVNLSAIPFVIFGVLLLLYPEKMARYRNRGAKDPTPSKDLIILFRYFGGTTLTIIGLLMLFY